MACSVCLPLLLWSPGSGEVVGWALRVLRHDAQESLREGKLLGEEVGLGG